MTPAEAAVALDDEPLDLRGFEANSEQPKTMPAPLMALYRLRAAALQMIANENDREAEAARERLELDKKIQAQTAFDWSRPVVAYDGPDPSEIVWEDEDTYFVW